MELKEATAKHRTAFISKLPTFGKSPLTNSKTIESLMIAGTSSAAKRPPLPGALRRRSKSSSDLKTDSARPLFSREPMPTIHAKKPLVTNNARPQKGAQLTSTTSIDLFSLNKIKPNLRRRSKSVTDLTNINVKPLVARNATNTANKTKDATKVLPVFAKNLRKMPIKVVTTGVKRTISDNKNDDQPKAKVLRPARIPPYDYKARFQHLEGIHLKLKSDHETLQHHFNSFKEEQSDFINQNNAIKARIKYLESENMNAHLEINNLKATNNDINLTNNNLLEEIEHLNGKVQSYQTNLETKTRQIEALQVSLQKVTADFDCSSKEVLALKESNNNIHAENEQGKLKIESLNVEIATLQTELENKDLIRQKLHNDIQDLKGNIRVFCRVRPQIRNEDKLMAVIKCSDDTEIEIRRLTESVSAITGKTAEIKQDFSFDRVFDENSTQSDIFLELSQLVQSALDGYNVCVFAYGQTGSGKTYTMQGYDAEDEGMIPRSLRVIFNYGETKKNRGWSFAIQASFLEIYNENLNDLLNIKNKEHMEICYNEGKGVSVKNLTIQPVETFNELRKLMAIAHKNRTVAATDFNLHSSRSHAVTQIHITALNSASKTKLTSTINLVDLAGSESAKTSSQERLTETKSINKSLSTLGTVMNDLCAGKTHVPYRNSKLTFLLQSCLGGNSKTLMVVHISPNDECYNESVSSLRFAAKVKSVKTMSKRNRTLV